MLCSAEDDQVADLAGDPVAVLLSREEARQSFGGDIGRDAARVDAGAGELQCLRVDVGREDLDGERLAGGPHLLQQQEGDGVGLLARGAAGHPRPQRRALRLPLHQGHDHQPPQFLVGLRIAEEAGDPDQEVLRQPRGLLRLPAQQVKVGVERLGLGDAHAAADPAQDGATLVAAEVRALPGQHREDLVEGLRLGRGRVRLAGGSRVAQITQDRLRHARPARQRSRPGPCAMALRGMESTAAVCGSWARASPPAARIARCPGCHLCRPRRGAHRSPLRPAPRPGNERRGRWACAPSRRRPGR